MDKRGMFDMKKGWVTGILNLILCLVLIFSVAGVAGADDGGRWSNPYLVRTFVDDKGREIAEIVVPGRPPEIKAAVALLPEPNPAMGINVLSNVPAFDWSYGCSATSAAMLFGYYDNTGYSNMYAGPTNGGVCPMDNSVWGPGVGGSDGECPLSATHQGIDGRTTKGHVDDYWIESGSTNPDPFIGHWTEHTHGDCTGDYMGTNQSLFGNTDGETTFYYYTNGAPLYDETDWEPDERDGRHGMRLFAESRGYTVNTNFTQLIKGQGTDPNKGFTFTDFQSEINAGQPVLIQVEGHTMLGYGYNTEGGIIYLHDTWDHSSHSMTWGGTYPYWNGSYWEHLQHYGVTVIQLEPIAAPNNPPNMPSNPTPPNHATGVSINADLSWTGGDPDAGDTVTYDVYFGTSVTPPLVSNDQVATTYDPGTSSYNTKYYWKIVATDNHAAPTAGPLWDFTTSSAPNNAPQLSSPSVQPTSGTPSTGFYYYVNYYDSDGDSPSVMQAYIDGTLYTMSLQSGSASNGVYRYGPRNLAAGSHNYYFYFEDGKGGTARLPTSGSYSGPVVSQANNPPNMPSNPSPGNHASGVSINADLSWTGGDPDAGDTVTYDVYFGTSSTPPLISIDQTGTTYDPGTLGYNTRYYWKIEATDNHAASTTGPLWYFTTTTTSLKDVQTYVGEFDPIRRMLYVFVRDYDGTPADCEKVEWLIEGPWGVLESLLEGTDEACTNPCYPTDYWDCEDASIAADGRSAASCTREMTADEIDEFVTEAIFADEDTADDYAIAGVLVLSSHLEEVDISIKIHDCWEGTIQIWPEDIIVGFSEDNPAVEVGLATIMEPVNYLVMVYHFDNGTKEWSWYNPKWPAGQNTLDTLYKGKAYWIKVSANCTLAYGNQSYDLYTGWNNIPWTGY